MVYSIYINKGNDMPRINKTQFAVLGCLNIRPMSAYEVKQFMARSTQYFWMEHEAQLYPTLKKLTADQLVNAKEEAAQKSGVRVIYEITDKGLEAFRDWLCRKTDTAPYRNEFLLKLFFGNEMDQLVLLERIKEYQTEAKSNLSHFQSITEELGNAPVKRQPYILATIKYGIHIMKAEIAWCDEVIQLIKSE